MKENDQLQCHHPPPPLAPANTFFGVPPKPRATLIGCGNMSCIKFLEVLYDFPVGKGRPQCSPRNNAKVPPAGKFRKSGQTPSADQTAQIIFKHYLKILHRVPANGIDISPRVELLHVASADGDIYSSSLYWMLFTLACSQDQNRSH